MFLLFNKWTLIKSKLKLILKPSINLKIQTKQKGKNSRQKKKIFYIKLIKKKKNFINI